MDPQTTTPGRSCCEEFAQVGLSRRGFLGGALATGVATTFGSTVVQVASAPQADAAPAGARAVMVVLSLRGAADGLSLVVPHGDPVYAQARPRIAVPADRLVAKDAFFGLHPALSPLLPLWNGGRMAAVHAAGLPAPNRSHFSAMEELEAAAPGSSIRSGWLNRLIGVDANPSPLQAMQVGEGTPPAALYGSQPFLSAGNIENVQLAGADQWDTHRGRPRSLRTLWSGQKDALGSAMQAAFTAVDTFQPARTSPKEPHNGATYPGNSLGRALAQVARVVRSGVGTEVVTVDHGDWDMHTDVGNLDWGMMKRNATELAEALAAFFADLGALGDHVTVVCLSEFGRRVAENANWGLDHGYGTVMLLLGAGVRGGYHGRWPGLTNSHDSDLLVTTDYRSVLAEVVKARFGTSTAAVFPGFTPSRVGAMVGQ
ncbi:DUF1501 domain-containing protein [Nocardioides daphniae]|uniref:DUF1501 domain-containing protein n=1 Tax=Nocardioides daphniae TaxID=402297 RepID=A0ABQ1QAZ7_9ACTN|nr:DUF1501 domain-containing protein [Nocardioides daphniae]GGD20016.1 hypothetical protein GCM10007231_19040 [Nocardioides daphniae]